MVNLSTERINKRAPYKVMKAKSDLSVTFTTDFGARYMVDFELSDLMPCVDAYQFGITNIDNKNLLAMKNYVKQ